MSKPSASEVSLVFQGPILTRKYNPKQGHLTEHCLAAARKVMPEAEIILSTWEGVDVAGLDFDQIVISKDPGYFRLDTGWTTNLNRQIVSTRNGLARASRPFVAKIRTDTLITDAGFLDVSRDPVERLAQWSIFTERILILESSSRNPALVPLLHHPSDLFQFGKTSDLIQWWDCLLAEVDRAHRWRKHESKPIITPFSYPGYYKNFCSRYYDEQYIWLECCRRHHLEVDLDYAWQARPQQILISESLLTANFKVVSNEEAGVRLPDRKTPQLAGNCYKSKDWDCLTALYQSPHNFFGKNVRIWKVYFGSWRYLMLATTQRLLISFLDYCKARYPGW